MQTTIDPKYLTPIQFHELDAFTRAYIQTALWSSTLPPFGECPECQKDGLVLDKWNQAHVHVCSDCAAREPNHEPPADQNYDWSHLAPECLARMRQDCATFQETHADLMAAAIAAGIRCGPDYDEAGHMGHDFWLTRCGHGAGFWDGDYEDLFGDQLTEAAQAFGNVDLYVGDDGRIHA